MRVAITTLGCTVNQYESQAMEEILLSRGHSLVPFEDLADVYSIISCTVTAVSDKKSRQTVRQARKRAPEAIVALCGCYPQVSPEGETHKAQRNKSGDCRHAAPDYRRKCGCNGFRHGLLLVVPVF